MFAMSPEKTPGPSPGSRIIESGVIEALSGGLAGDQFPMA